MSVLYSISLYSQPAVAQAISPLCIGETTEFHSAILGENRKVNIYLPEGYDKNDGIAYPVIYLLDGSYNEDFIHITGLVQFFNLQLHMPKTIVIGISNIDRKRDFTFPTKVKESKEKYPTTGGSQAFMNFIENELQPYISARYKTSDSRFLIGQSLGGLLATEILLRRPSMFTHYIIISPSLWWDDESLLKEAPRLLANATGQLNANIYISVGSEGKVMEKDAEALVRLLKKSGKEGYKVSFVPLPKENHATILHQSVYEALKIFFPYKE